MMPGTRAAERILTPIACLACSVATGVAVYGGRVCDPALAHFQFVVSGLICGVLILFAQARRGLYTLIGCAVAFVVRSTAVGSLDVGILARNALFVAGLLAAVSGSLHIEERARRLAIGKFALWAAIFGIVHLCMFAAFSLARRGSVAEEPATFQVTAGALIGAGVGLGHEIMELAARRKIWRTS